jgi:purine-binding chemotaxis protein CheW
MERLDFLCVMAADKRIAIPLNLVLSVEEAGPLTPLPFSPGRVEGLVMALGRVLPQMALADVLGETPRPGGVLVVTAASDDVRALRVDQVAGMVQIEVEAVNPCDEAERAARPLITARFAALADHWDVLDYVKLTADQPMQPAEAAQGAALVAAAGAETPPAAETPLDGGDAHLALLMTEISGERYALPTAGIVELLVPGVIRSMPAAPAWVAGLIDRRSAPLLVLSSAVLLGRPPAAGATIVLVVEIAGAGDIGLLVDRAVGIERIPHSDIHAVTQDMAGVANYFVIAHEQIVGIIDPAALAGQVGGALKALVPREPPTIAEAPEVAAAKSSHRLLSMRVGRELVALPLERVERIQAAVVLTPLPQPGTGFHGMADVGDATVPIFDLRRLMAESGADPNPPCTLVEIEGALVGLAVDQVLRIEDIPDHHLEDIATHPVLPVSHVAHSGDRLLSVLVVDRVLPPLDKLTAIAAE